MRKMSKILLIVLITFLSSSVGNNYFQRGTLQKTGVFKGNSFYKKPRIVKEIDTYKNYGDSFVKYDNILIYITDIPDGNSAMIVLDIDTYEIIWKNDNNLYLKEMNIYDGKLYVDGKRRKNEKYMLLCINPLNGEIIWEQKSVLKYIESYTFYNNMIIYSTGIRNHDSYIVFLDLKTGKYIKKIEMKIPNKKPRNYEGGEPALFIYQLNIYKDILVYNSLGYGYVAYDLKSNTFLWNYDAVDFLFMKYNINVIDEDNVYFFNYGPHKIFKMNILNGNKIQEFENFRGCGDFIIDDELIYFISKDDSEYVCVNAYNKKNNEKKWTTTIDYDKKLGSPFITMLYKIGDILYYSYGPLYAIDSKTGKLLWKERFNYKELEEYSSVNFIQSICVIDDKLIVATKNNVGEEGTGKLFIMEEDDRNWFQKLIDNISKIFQ